MSGEIELIENNYFPDFEVMPFFDGSHLADITIHGFKNLNTLTMWYKDQFPIDATKEEIEKWLPFIAGILK